MRQRLAPLLEVAVVEQAAAGDAPLADLKPRGGDAVEVGAAAALADDDVDRAGVGGGGEADGVALGLDRGEVAGGEERDGEEGAAEGLALVTTWH
jgi:hypothetical protein